MTNDKQAESVEAFLSRMGIKATSEQIDARPDDRDALTLECEADRESKARRTLDSPHARHEHKERARSFLRGLEWKRTASHWRVTFKRKDGKRSRSFVAYYSMGKAHTGEPNPAEVMDALRSDAQSSEEAFPGWCDSLGYDSDSRESERIWRACRDTAKRLEAFLSTDGLTALYSTEPL